MNKWYTISINGQTAVNAGYAFQKDSCYRGIYNHGERIAQLEVVLDEPTIYNGLPVKWVDVSHIEGKNVSKVWEQLKRLGFSACWAILIEETEIDTDFTQKEICHFKI